MRAISSVGQSHRLITGWSKVRALDGPPKQKDTPSRGVLLFWIAFQARIFSDGNAVRIRFAHPQSGCFAVTRCVTPAL